MEVSGLQWNGRGERYTLFLRCPYACRYDSALGRMCSATLDALRSLDGDVSVYGDKWLAHRRKEARLADELTVAILAYSNPNSRLTG